MRNHFIILFFALLVPYMAVNGQFYGGDGEGYGREGSLPGTMSPQEVFCSGGDADGCHSQGTDLVTMNPQYSYCTGGGSDGISSVYSGVITFNDQYTYCRGGNNDGASDSGYEGNFFDPLSVFDGGNSDGVASGAFNGLLFDLSFTRGGVADGTSSTASGMTSINEQALYCRAGNGDGYGSYLYNGSFMPWLYCQGGSGDGFKGGLSAIEEMGSGIWTGYTSSEWNEATNWKLNIIPSSSTNVLIPGGAPHHPVLNESLSVDTYAGVHPCKRLDIYPGGRLTTSDDLIVNGILKVAGTLELRDPSWNALQVESNGKVTVKAGGEIRVGE